MGSGLADHLPPGWRQLSPQGCVYGVSEKLGPIRPQRNQVEVTKYIDISEY